MMTVPRFAHAYAELALVAADLRDRRGDGDPRLVADGKLTGAEAADRLRIAAAVAADWAAIAAMRPAPPPTATDAEKLAMLEQAAAVVRSRADRAHAAMLAEAAWLGHTDRGALWQLVEAHDPLTHRIQPWLHQESYAAALDALLWWQRRTGTDGIRWLTDTNIWLRERSANGAGRRAA